MQELKPLKNLNAFHYHCSCLSSLISPFFWISLDLRGSFWFWPSPSAPGLGRTPAGTCTHTSSPAPADAPCRPRPKAGDSQQASYSQIPSPQTAQEVHWKRKNHGEGGGGGVDGSREQPAFRVRQKAVRRYKEQKKHTHKHTKTEQTLHPCWLTFCAFMLYGHIQTHTHQKKSNGASVYIHLTLLVICTVVVSGHRNAESCDLLCFT